MEAWLHDGILTVPPWYSLFLSRGQETQSEEVHVGRQSTTKCKGKGWLGLDC